MAGNITASDMYEAISDGKRIALPLNMSNETLAGNLVIDKTYGNIVRLDPAGARNVTLPALYDGAFYLLINAADNDESIAVKKPDGTALGDVGQNQTALICCFGGQWAIFAKFTTAL